MAKETRKNLKKKNNKENKNYSSENEIIIGVTTKVKENARVEKKPTCAKPTKNAINKITNERKNNSAKSKDKKANNIKNKKNKIQNNKNRKSEKEIKRLNRKRTIISIFLLLLIVICGTIYYLTTPAFNIANIVIYGNKKNEVDTYISLSKINIGDTNIFAVTNNSIKKRLKENSYVEDVYIKRKLPNILEIYVEEREVNYQINYSDIYIYLNDQGYILEISEENKNVPIIKGLSSIKEELKVGQRLNNEDLFKLDTVLKIINYCKYNSIESNITSIDVENVSNYILNFDEEGKIAYLGDASNLSERILWLKTILEKEEKSKGEIFINGDLQENKVYFRESK